MDVVETKVSVEEAIRSRRSVRVYTVQPVPDETIRELLELGLLAPNSSNLQAWEFYWIRDPKVREALNHAFLSQSAVRTAPALIVAVARTATWRQHAKEMIATVQAKQSNVPQVLKNYYGKIVPFVYTVGPFGIFGAIKAIITWFAGLARPVPRGPYTRAGLQTWAVKTTALACENIMIAARAKGLDTCPMEGFDAVRVRKILSLPSDAVVVMGISIGYRDPVKGLWGEQLRYSSDRFIKKI